MNVGSTGSGTFGNYKPNEEDDQCFNDLENVMLEDVARLTYYQEYQELPPMKENVYVMDSLYNSRIAVKSTENESVIGYLPTKYNYLLSCLQKGIKYSGQISFSLEKPILRVVVSLYAE